MRRHKTVPGDFIGETDSFVTSSRVLKEGHFDYDDIGYRKSLKVWIFHCKASHSNRQNSAADRIWITRQNLNYTECDDFKKNEDHLSSGCKTSLVVWIGKWDCIGQYYCIFVVSWIFVKHFIDISNVYLIRYKLYQIGLSHKSCMTLNSINLLYLFPKVCKKHGDYKMLLQVCRAKIYEN